MIGAGHPEGQKALHPPRPDEHVLEGVVEGVAEVEGAGDVRRGDDDREHGATIPRPGRLGMPQSGGIPQGPAAGLGGGVVVVLGEFVHRGALARGRSVGSIAGIDCRDREGKTATLPEIAPPGPARRAPFLHCLQRRTSLEMPAPGAPAAFSDPVTPPPHAHQPSVIRLHGRAAADHPPRPRAGK